MRKLVAAGAGMLALVAFPAPAAAATRHVWIAAVPTTWNVVPNERNAIEGERYTVDKTTMRTVVYEQFTRNWRRKLPAQTRIPGPLIKARVGDDIFIHFKNADTGSSGRTPCTSTGCTTRSAPTARSSPASRAPAAT